MTTPEWILLTACAALAAALFGAVLLWLKASHDLRHVRQSITEAGRRIERAVLDEPDQAAKDRRLASAVRRIYAQPVAPPEPTS